MKLEFFEPSMCCSTGICGPSVDERLIRIKENMDLLSSKYKDLKIYRYQISQQPVKFSTNRAVFALVKEHGKKALPITALNGEVIKYGEYPTLEEMEKAINGGKNEN